MKKKKLLKSKWLLPLVFIAIVTATITLYVIAKYAGTADVESKANLQGFDVTPVITGYETWNSDTGVVKMTAVQYANFTLAIEKSGNGWAYIRISIDESWRIRDNSTGVETVAATTGGTLSWDTNLGTNATDNFQYVDGIVTDPGTIPIIGPSSIAASDITVGTGKELVVRLSIKVEAIQYNRLFEFWGIDPGTYPN